MSGSSRIIVDHRGSEPIILEYCRASSRSRRVYHIPGDELALATSALAVKALHTAHENLVDDGHNWQNFYALGDLFFSLAKKPENGVDRCACLEKALFYYAQAKDNGLNPATFQEKSNDVKKLLQQIGK